MNKDTIFDVTNRSGSIVVYNIEEDHLRREFQPGETKQISYDEMQKLAYQPGGKELINGYLLVRDPDAVESLHVPVEPEYYMTDAEVINLLQNESLDKFLDALDFAPQGVIDLIKDYAVKLPLNDVSKRKALLDKFDFNVDAAVQFKAESEAEAVAPQGRRVPLDENKQPSGRRVSINR